MTVPDLDAIRRMLADAGRHEQLARINARVAERERLAKLGWNPSLHPRDALGRFIETLGPGERGPEVEVPAEEIRVGDVLAGRFGEPDHEVTAITHGPTGGEPVIHYGPKARRLALMPKPGAKVRIRPRARPERAEVEPGVFAAAFARAYSENRRIRIMTTEHKPSEYTRTYLSPDGKTGVALIGDEVVNLFNVGEPGAGKPMLRQAIADGGRRLDCTGPTLRDYYAEEGFVVTDSAPFDPKLAHPEWDTARDGTPNIYFMEIPA